MCLLEPLQPECCIFPVQVDTRVTRATKSSCFFCRSSGKAASCSLPVFLGSQAEAGAILLQAGTCWPGYIAPS